MRTSRAAAAAVVTAVLPALLTLGGPAAQADPLVPTAVSLVRQPPDYPAVFHDRIDHGTGSLPGVDAVAYRATLSAAAVPLAGAAVVLQRKLVGQSSWQDLATATTALDGTADFTTPVKGNATYQVSYAGNALLAPVTSDPVTLEAMRDLNAYIPAGAGAVLAGNINPGWGRRTVSWQKRSCETCHWRTVAKQRSSKTGAWRFQGAYPRGRGTWWFRASVAGTPTFVTSTSSMLKTRR